MVVSSTLTTGDLMALLTYCMNILMNLMMLSMVFVNDFTLTRIRKTNQRGIK